VLFCRSVYYFFCFFLIFFFFFRFDLCGVNWIL
jgi:hypothetical protein